MDDPNQTYHPTMMFGFMLNAEGKEVLSQMWCNALGHMEFRPVPMIEMKDERKSAIAGYLDGDDD